MSDLKQILASGIGQIEAAQTVHELDDVRVQFLGQKGTVTLQLKQLGQLPPEQRKTAGQEINQIKQQL
ncbi:MAG: phenylalanine--tRNA ligase subunit alpha, partial [Xanthomonadales bacterium]|nr:phenylalanine--tRNA ligase subunit alpha [Xanthomonadales bacterium]